MRATPQKNNAERDICYRSLPDTIKIFEISLIEEETEHKDQPIFTFTQMGVIFKVKSIDLHQGGWGCGREIGGGSFRQHITRDVTEEVKREIIDDAKTSKIEFRTRRGRA